MPPRVKIRGTKEYAGMLESVDWTDLGSVVERRVGSSPTARTTNITAVHFDGLPFYPIFFELLVDLLNITPHTRVTLDIPFVSITVDKMEEHTSWYAPPHFVIGVFSGILCCK